MSEERELPAGQRSDQQADSAPSAKAAATSPAASNLATPTVAVSPKSLAPADRSPTSGNAGCLAPADAIAARPAEPAAAAASASVGAEDSTRKSRRHIIQQDEVVDLTGADSQCDGDAADAAAPILHLTPIETQCPSCTAAALTPDCDKGADAEEPGVQPPQQVVASPQIPLDQRPGSTPAWLGRFVSKVQQQETSKVQQQGAAASAPSTASPAVARAASTPAGSPTASQAVTNQSDAKLSPAVATVSASAVGAGGVVGPSNASAAPRLSPEALDLATAALGLLTRSDSGLDRAAAVKPQIDAAACGSAAASGECAQSLGGDERLEPSAAASLLPETTCGTEPKSRPDLANEAREVRAAFCGADVQQAADPGVPSSSAAVSTSVDETTDPGEAMPAATVDDASLSNVPAVEPLKRSSGSRGSRELHFLLTEAADKKAAAGSMPRPAACHQHYAPTASAAPQLKVSLQVVRKFAQRPKQAAAAYLPLQQQPRQRLSEVGNPGVNDDQRTHSPPKKVQRKADRAEAGKSRAESAQLDSISGAPRGPRSPRKPRSSAPAPAPAPPSANRSGPALARDLAASSASKAAEDAAVRAATLATLTGGRAPNSNRKRKATYFSLNADRPFATMSKPSVRLTAPTGGGIKPRAASKQRCLLPAVVVEKDQPSHGSSPGVITQPNPSLPQRDFSASMSKRKLRSSDTAVAARQLFSLSPQAVAPRTRARKQTLSSLRSKLGEQVGRQGGAPVLPATTITPPLTRASSRYQLSLERELLQLALQPQQQPFAVEARRRGKHSNSTPLLQSDGGTSGSSTSQPARSNSTLLPETPAPADASNAAAASNADAWMNLPVTDFMRPVGCVDVLPPLQGGELRVLGCTLHPRVAQLFIKRHRQWECQKPRQKSIKLVDNHRIWLKDLRIDPKRVVQQLEHMMGLDKDPRANLPTEMPTRFMQVGAGWGRMCLK